MRKIKECGFMISNKIKITEEGEFYDRLEIAFIILNIRMFSTNIVLYYL